MSERWDRLKSFLAECGRQTGKTVGVMGKLHRWMPRRHVLIPVLIAVWVLSGIFIVAPSDQGVVLRWGRLVRIAEPGLHYHWPWPIEKIRAYPVERVQRIIVDGLPPISDNISSTKWLLTADRQLVEISAVAQTRIASVQDYVSHLKAPRQIVADAARAALNAVVAQHPLQAVLTDGKSVIEQQVAAALRDILDKYGCGLRVVAVNLTAARPPAPVQDAFADMARARALQRQALAEATAYANKLLPLAHGQAEQMRQTAETYKTRQINQAQGDAERFLARLEAYRQAPAVTRKRIYLDAMAEIAGQAATVLLPTADSAVLPTLPLDKLMPLVDRVPIAAQESE